MSENKFKVGDKGEKENDLKQIDTTETVQIVKTKLGIFQITEIEDGINIKHYDGQPFCVEGDWLTDVDIYL